MRRLLSILSTPTARSSAFFYFGNLALSFGRYLFHLVLLRLLLPSEYGEFLAYLSLLYLLGIPSSTISTVVTKYVSEFRGRKNDRAIRSFFYFMVVRLTPLTVLMSTSLVILAPVLAVIFKANQGAFVILGISVLLNLFGAVVRSYLTALQMFVASILTGLLEITITITLAVMLIRLGLSATGVVSAQLIASVIGLLLTLFILRRAIFPPIKNGIKTFDIRSFSSYSLIFAIGSISLFSVDILLVRYLFDIYSSGIYSSLSILGRMIYFGLGPLITLILPIASHRHAATKSSRSVLQKLGIVLLLFGLPVVGLFSFFPDTVVTILSGSRYIEAAAYLPLVAITMMLFSINIFTISYLMAIGKPQVNLFLLLATAAQPLLIVIFHQTLSQVININLFIQILLFASILWRLKTDGI